MGNANFRVHLGKLALPTTWVEYVAPINCWSIELTGDQEWCWCTDKTSEAVRTVPAFQHEGIITRAQMLIKEGEPIIWIKGKAEGFIYEKCVR